MSTPKQTLTAEGNKSERDFTVVLTGGKMSKTVHLARCIRSFAMNDPSVTVKIIILETKKFRYSASRFSRCVDAFEVITSPRDSPDAYMNDIYAACEKHGATHFLPVAAPVEAVYDAQLKPRLESDLGVNVLHMDHNLCKILDDKHSFGCFLRDELKLRSPRTHKVHSNEEARKYNTQFKDEMASGELKRTMILKNLNYDPIHRLDLFQLPTSEAKLDAYLSRVQDDGNAITESEPWQVQEFLARGVEYSAMIVVRSNQLVTMTCSASSASQLNYVHVEVPSIRVWIEDFMTGLRASKYTLTGQLCFDFMILTENDEHVAYPIECNPRVHTQCSIYNSDDARSTLGSLLLESPQVHTQNKMIRLLKRDYENDSSKPSINAYWFYNEFFKIVPNSWLFLYNGSEDTDDRAKELTEGLPMLSYQAMAFALLYTPAAILSLFLLLPVMISLYVSSMFRVGEESKMGDIEHLQVVMIRMVHFVNRLAYLNENIEGDFWLYDPIPFLAKNHVQVASRLLATIRTGVEWKKLDFAIGKVVEVGGD